MKPEFDPYAKFAIFHAFDAPDRHDPYEDSRMIREMVMKEMKKKKNEEKTTKEDEKCPKNTLFRTKMDVFPSSRSKNRWMKATKAHASPMSVPTCTSKTRICAMTDASRSTRNASPAPNPGSA